MKRWRRLTIVVFGLVESLIFSGCLFGWPSLLHVLQEEGVYSHLRTTEPHENATTSSFSDPGHSTSKLNSVTTSAPLWTDNSDNTSSELLSFQTITTPIPPEYSKADVSFDTISASPNTVPTVTDTDSNNDMESTEGLSTKSTSQRQEELDPNTSPELSSTQSRNAIRASRSPENEQEPDEEIPLPQKLQCLELNDEERSSSKVGCANSVTDNPDTMEMTLIYTVAGVAYGLTSVLVGFALDFCGLWFTRILGSMMTTGGFICLAFTSKETPWLLWPALNLIALGTNQLRLSTFQFANLWPQRRTTILIAYSSAYSISTTLFLLIQYGYGAGIPFQTICFFLVGVSALTLPLTFILPLMRTEDHIEVEFEPACKSDNPNPTTEKLINIVSDQDEDNNVPRILRTKRNSKDIPPIDHFDESEEPVYKETTVDEKVPLGSSLWTLSALLHTGWTFINFFLILFYSATFIPWLQKMPIVEDRMNRDSIIEHYNQVLGLCSLIAPVFIPIAGLVTDWQIRKASELEDPIERLALTMQAPAFTMAIATIFLLGTMICKVFFTSTAIYVSSVLIAVSRPFVVGSFTSYVRIRFHPSHFNRLNGIFITIVSLMSMIQYRIILWMNKSTENFVNIHLILIVLLILSLISPGHLMIKPIARKYARAQLKFRTEM